MGLDQDRFLNAYRKLRPGSHWSLALAVSAVSVFLAAFGDLGRGWFRYDRIAVADGEIWRFVSGHLVHLGVQHLLLNLAGLLLVWLLVGRFYTTARWAFVLLASILCIDLGFWILDTEMLWYVGLSGVLHGLMVAGALQGSREKSVELLVLLVLIIAKLSYEQLTGPLPGSEATSGGAVVVNAHLYGAIGGVLAAVVLWRRVGQAASI